MDVVTLGTVLENHRKWTSDDICGQRADLRGADLSDANLSNAKNR